MWNKRGISAVVATVLIILITVAAVAIVWTAIIPMIKTNLELGTVCLEADVLIDGGSGYTCYDSEGKIASVQVRKGASEVDISEVEFLLDSEGTSRKITKSFDLGSNIGKTFYFIVDEDVDGASIAPVIKIRNKERVCDISSNVKLRECSLVSTNLDEEYAAYWRFEDNLLDITGGSDGIFSGEPVYIEGRNGIGKALSFDGVDDYVSVSDNVRLSGSQTITFWYRHSTGIITSFQGILGGSSFSGDIDRGHAIGISQPDNIKLVSDIYSGDPYGNHRSTLEYPFPQDTDWHFIASSYDADTNTHKFYLDDAIKSKNPIFLTYQIDWGTTPLRIGDSGYDHFNGTIDEVMIFDKALSGDEVEELYESQK